MSKEHDDIEDLFFDDNDESDLNIDIVDTDSYVSKRAADSLSADKKEEGPALDIYSSKVRKTSAGSRNGKYDPHTGRHVRYKKNSNQNFIFIVIAAVVVVILILVILMLSGVFGSKKTDVSESAPDQTEEVEEPQALLTLQEEGSDIYNLISTYLSARIINDLDTLATVVDDASALPESDSTSAFFASYNDIQVYTAAGLEEGDYVAFVCSNVDLTDYDKDLPDLQYFYIRTDEGGNKYIATAPTDEENAYMTELTESDEVEDLINDVWSQLNDLAESDEELAAIISVLYSIEDLGDETNEITGNVTADPDEGTHPEDYNMTEVNDSVTATATVNIRKTPSTEAEILGAIPEGETVSRSHHGANWSYITYNGVSGFVMTEFLTEAG